MAVETINLNDFLVQKNSGDVVTGSDWNKLVALFHAVNNNANELLEAIKNIDTNTANIAYVTQGTVPDGSIGYDKLEKIGGTKNTYTFTTDTVPDPQITYFTLEGDTFVAHSNLTTFVPGVQYYVLEVRATQAAIADGDVIGDGVIENYHIAEHALLPSACSEFLLGGLLNDNATIYTDKSVSGSIPSSETSTTLEHTITLDKQHKAVVIVNPRSLIILTADENKPNLFIGGSLAGLSTGYLVSDGIYIRSTNGSPQMSYNPWMAAPHCYLANYPSGLVPILNWASGSKANSVQLTACTYDYATKSISLRMSTLATDKNYYESVDYKFGYLIIGL